MYKVLFLFVALLTTGCTYVDISPITVSPEEINPLIHLTLDGTGYDVSNRYLGTIVGGCTATQNRFGQNNKAMFFDGTGYIVFPYSLHPTGNPDLTYTCWVNAPIYGTAVQKALINVGVWNPKQASLFYLQENWISYSIDSAYTWFRFDRNPYKNKWMHLTLVKNKNITTLYVNGVKQLSGTLPEQQLQSTKIVIGGSDDPKRTSFNFIGILDDVRVYTRALTDEEVLIVYNQGD